MTLKGLNLHVSRPHFDTARLQFLSNRLHLPKRTGTHPALTPQELTVYVFVTVLLLSIAVTMFLIWEQTNHI